MADKSTDMATHIQTLGLAVSAATIGGGMNMLGGQHAYWAWGLIVFGVLVLAGDGAWVVYQLVKPRGVPRVPQKVKLALAAGVIAVSTATAGYSVGRWHAPAGEQVSQPAVAANAPHLTSEQIKQPYLRGATFYLFDYARESEDFMISDKVFEDCTILGPAVIWADPESRMIGGDVDADVEFAFLEVPDKTPLHGIIRLRRVTTRNCKFKRIKFLVSPGEIERIKKGLAERVSP